MSYKVKRLHGKDKGTYYGVFINELMIHYDYRRGRANEIVEELHNGKILAEIIAADISREESRKFQTLLDVESAKSSELERKLFQAEKQISQAKLNLKRIDSQPSPVHVSTSIENEPDKGEISKFMFDHSMDETEAKELSALISEVRTKGFEYSKELSRYILKNRLKHKYKNISGVVKMEKSGEQWNFSGGFPKKIYGIVCSELELLDQGTTAKAVGFKSFKDIDELF